MRKQIFPAFGLLALLSLSARATRADAPPNGLARGSASLERLSPYLLSKPHTMAYDRARGRVVVHALRPQSEGYPPVAETWELEGESFRFITDKGPLPLANSQVTYSRLIYDEKNGVSVLLPAQGPSGQIAAWQWDGTSWSEQSSTIGAPMFSDRFAAVYHRKRQKIYTISQFDDRRIISFHDGTWDVHKKTPTPIESIDFSAAYDDERDRIVFFGGSEQSQQNIVWQWDEDAGWEALTPPSPRPSSRFGAGMVFDEVRREVLLHGGNSTEGEAPTDSWSWNGVKWKKLSSGGPPLSNAPLVWDAAGQRALTLGGIVNYPSSHFRYHWLDGEHQWQESPLSTKLPQGRNGALLVAVEGGLFLSGGQPISSGEAKFLGDTWRFSEGTWSRLETAAPEPAGMAAAPLPSGEVLSFGPQGTFRLSASGWEKLSPATEPPPRGFAAMGNDVDGSVLLFGGEDEAMRGDLWRWDGKSWVQISPEAGASPQPRARAQLIRHEALGKIVLFGGRTSLGELSDTWLWDGKRWDQLESKEFPRNLGDAHGTYDSQRKAILLRAQDQLWVLADGPWQQQPVRGKFPLLRGAQLAHDRQRGQTFVFGGLYPVSGSELGGDLFSLTFVGQACGSSDDCSSGACVDGVCCGQPQCGFCEACNVPGEEGRCAPLVANQKDPDSCAEDQTCDGQGGCKKALGEACQAPSDCAGGAHCADGACCLEAACSGACSSCRGQPTGLCGVVTDAPNPPRCGGDLRCDSGGDCKKTESIACQSGDECASGRCTRGRCVDARASLCVEGNTASLPGDVEVPCGAFLCSGGACKQRCLSTEDCASGARCDEAGRCSFTAVSEQPQGGCSQAPRGSPSWAWGLLLALALASRRKAAAAALVLLATTQADARPRVEARLLSPWRLPTLGSAAAGDAKTGEVLLFGGFNFYENKTTSELWSWDGTSYRRTPAETPGPRNPQGFVHDRAKDRFLLIGDSAGLNPEGWVWDRTSWSRLPSRITPLLLSSRALQWDQANQRVLLVQLASASEKILELSDDDQWTPVAGSTGGPSTRTQALIGMDEGRGVLVVAGGIAPDGQWIPETWEWDGAQWTTQSPGSPPPPPGSLLAFHPARKALIACGQPGEGALLCLSWDGLAWQNDVPAPPEQVIPAQLFQDSQRGTIALEFIDQFDPLDRTTMILDQGGWVTLPQATPSPRRAPSGAYDPVGKRAVFFGGRTLLDVGTAFTWSYTQGQWSMAPTGAPTPPELSYPAMTFDPTSQGLILFGGEQVNNQFAPYGSTWLLKGSDWLEVSTAGPKPRTGTSMVTDVLRNRVVLFGGRQAPPDELANDTWIWDGASWTEFYPQTPPSPARYRSLLVYDKNRDRVVLFGGRVSGNILLNDTWEFDGTNWERKQPPHAPRPQADIAGYYDPLSKKVVLAGGITSYSPYTSDTSFWTWDGLDWEEIAHQPPLGFGGEAILVYDPQARAGISWSPYGPDASFVDLGTRSTRIIGNECSSLDVCATPFCSEGVCCLEQDCGPCRSCALSGSEGECTALPRGSLDPRCPKGNACDDGRCVAQAGLPCQQGSDCLSGSCVDGVCCARSACGVCETCAAQGHQGECAPILDAPDPGTCDGSSRCSREGRCGKIEDQPCQLPDECASGVCLGGLCKPEGPPVCDGDHTLYSRTGAVDCGAFRCTPEGACLKSCERTADCATGYRCTGDGGCILETQEVSKSGCSMQARHSSAGAALASLLALAALCSRRRPR